MDASQLANRMNETLQGRLLLEHPFYRRWEAGELAMSELADYADEYRNFETILPAFLAELAAKLPEGPARDLVEGNHRDEVGATRSHLQLFNDFGQAVGARGARGTRPAAATKELVNTYRFAIDRGPLAALASLAAYEIQAADIAQSKAEGLRSHYGLDGEAVEFWDLHATVDRDHAEWVVEALVCTVQSEEDAEKVLADVGRAADAWWAFLDEREAGRPVAA